MKILYISSNSKPEELSTSRTMAREFINGYLQNHPHDQVEELDLYHSYIPLLNYKLFHQNATLVQGEEYDALSDDEKNMVNRINELCKQFLSADKYIISAPMWSIFFPAILKQYLDCIFINGMTINIQNDKVTGLLGDRERKMVYIQSSGGTYPALLSRRLNHGSKYLEDIFTFLGIKTFKKIMIEGVNDDDIGKEEAMKEARIDMNHILKRF